MANRDWLFQVSPNKCELEDALAGFEDGDTDYCPITGGWNEMEAGQRGILWRNVGTGGRHCPERAGIHALVELTGPACRRTWEPEPDDWWGRLAEAEWWAPIRYVHIFSPPIGLDELRANPDTHVWGIPGAVHGRDVFLGPEDWGCLEPLLTERISQDLGETVSGASENDTIESLRARALEATAAARAAIDGQRVIYPRSRDVARYVLERGQGRCESCDQEAPFLRRDGRPYLIPHHTDPMSGGGDDDIYSVGAICPNCHDEIHYGLHGDEKNEELRAYILEVERSCDG